MTKSPYAKVEIREVSEKHRQSCLLSNSLPLLEFQISRVTRAQLFQIDIHCVF